MRKNREFYSINFTTFFLTAKESFYQIQKLNRFFLDKKEMTIDDGETACNINYNIQRLSITTIIFCTITLESFINYYGATNLTKKYFENYLDKFDLKSKWVIIPRLITGKQIDTGCRAFCLFSNLITLRNKLVHDKVKSSKETLHDDNDFLWETDASSAIECVELMIKELKKIDNNAFSDWLNN